MDEMSSENLVDLLADPIVTADRAGEATTDPSPAARPGPVDLNLAADSFVDLLGELELDAGRISRNEIIARYKVWIGQHSEASSAVYAAWFNLGVELSAAGTKDAAIAAYRNVLALRPGFYPAAINLGTLLESIGQPDAALTVWEQALQPEDLRGSLLAYRTRLMEDQRVERQVLHFGLSANGSETLPPAFRQPGWREIRVNVDLADRPDFVAKMTNLHAVADHTIDAVSPSDVLTQLYAHELPSALREMHRVLKPAGTLLATLPDLEAVARHITEGGLAQALYMSALGPIAPLDILYGYRPFLANGNVSIAPRNGFTAATLAAALIETGFAAVLVQHELSVSRLSAIAFRNPPGQDEIASARMQMLPGTDRPAVLYTPSA